MAKDPMVMYSFRLPKQLRDDANKKAEEQKENVSDILRAALERYVEGRP